jgi:hypothetical protein
MAVFLDLRGWARDAMADGLIQTAPLAQPPVARNASQQHRGKWRLLASARQLIRFQAATLAELGSDMLLDYARPLIMQILVIMYVVLATCAPCPARFAHEVLLDVALVAHERMAYPTLNTVPLRLGRVGATQSAETRRLFEIPILREPLQLVVCLSAGFVCNLCC